MDELSIVLLARLLIGALFIFAPINNLINHKRLIEIMRGRKIPFTVLVFFSAFLLQLIAGIYLVLGFKVKLATIILIVFVILATVIFHDFWNVKGDSRREQLLALMTNLSTIGGLLLLFNYY